MAGLFTRRSAVASGAAGMLFSPARASERSLNFVAVGDWGRDGAFHQIDVARRMGETAQGLGAAFVVSVGDNFYEAGVFSVRDPKWRSSFEDIYTAPSLQVPWLAMLGNHDYLGSIAAQIAYSRISRRWRMPARRYVTRHVAPDGARLDLIAFDSAPIVSMFKGGVGVDLLTHHVASEMAWLDGVLKGSDADWKIVACHHPVLSGGAHGSTPILVEHMKPILERRGVAMQLFGHDHDLQLIQDGPVKYVGTGAGSQTRTVQAIAGTKFCSDRSGFTSYQVSRTEIVVRHHDFEGALLHEIAVPPVV